MYFVILAHHSVVFTKLYFNIALLAFREALKTSYGPMCVCLSASTSFSSWNTAGLFFPGFLSVRWVIWVLANRMQAEVIMHSLDFRPFLSPYLPALCREDSMETLRNSR